MTKEEILVERRDSVACIVLNRPERRNPLGLGCEDSFLSLAIPGHDQLHL